MIWPRELEQHRLGVSFGEGSGGNHREARWSPCRVGHFGGEARELRQDVSFAGGGQATPQFHIPAEVVSELERLRSMVANAVQDRDSELKRLRDQMASVAGGFNPFVNVLKCVRGWILCHTCPL